LAGAQFGREVPVPTISRKPLACLLPNGHGRGRSWSILARCPSRRCWSSRSGWGGHRYSDEGRIRAVGLWAGPQGVITGPAAAYWHRMLGRAPAVVDLTVPAGLKPKPQLGVRIRRRDLHAEDVRRRLDVRVAAKPFAALETAVALPDGSTFLDRALQQHVPFVQVYRAYCRNMGRPGSAAAGRMLVAAADRADSPAERLLREAGIGGWVLGHPLGPYRIAHPGEAIQENTETLAGAA
jgi:hypothetical protein